MAQKATSLGKTIHKTSTGILAQPPEASCEHGSCLLSGINERGKVIALYFSENGLGQATLAEVARKDIAPRVTPIEASKYAVVWAKDLRTVEIAVLESTPEAGITFDLLTAPFDISDLA